MDVLLVVALVVVAVVALGALVTVRILRRLQRAVEQGRRRVDAAKARMQPPGPRRDVALLRQRLADEMESTRQLLEAIPPGTRIFLAEAQPVLAELATTGAELDAELAVIETFRDPAEQRRALATITAQVEQVVAASYSARQTMLRTAVADRERGLSSLSDTVAGEAESLANYQRRRRDLTL